MTGPKLTIDNILAVIAEYKAKGYLVQRKLNVDRGVLEITPAGPMLWNRYGSEYCASEVDLSAWNALPSCILDGEVYRGEFYPFECLTCGENATQTLRIGVAENICRNAGQPYIFGGITNDWLIGEVTLDTNPRTRMWEGCVMKLASAKYVPLKKPDNESAAWTKLRWC
jgi:hypothetical protein